MEKNDDQRKEGDFKKGRKRNLERRHNLVYTCEANSDVHNIRNFNKVNGIIFHQKQTGKMAFMPDL